MKNNDEIRLTDLFHAMYKHKIFIACLTAVGLLLGVILSMVSYMRGEMSKKYAITSAIAVTSQTQDGKYANSNYNPTSTDIYLAEDMVDSVIYVLKSDQTLNQAADNIQLIGVSTKDIYDNLKMEKYKNTQIIEMTLFWRSAEEGVRILEAINQVAPEILIGTLKIGSVSVVNLPTARYLIGGSVNIKMWVMMMMFGFCAAAGLSILQQIIWPTLINTEDVVRLLGMNIIGEIPHHKTYFKKKKVALEDTSEAIPMEVSENFASCAHIFMNMIGRGRHQCICFTSSGPDEGKTTVAANFAVKLSELEKKVLLIDFDTRNPNLGSMFLDKIEYQNSLNGLYRGESLKEQAITRITGFLDILPVILEYKGLALDDAMLQLVESLSQDYDYVIMDTSPVGRVADMMKLNKICNASIFVIRNDTATLSEIKDSLDRLEKSGMRILGCIVNDVKRLSVNGYYSNYSRRYGKVEGSKKEKKNITTKA